MGALRARPGPLAMPLDPLAQHLVDARLPAWSGGSEMPKHLRREVDVRMDLRVRLLLPSARTRERALRRSYHLAPDRDLGALELLFCPFGRIVGINPDAPDSALFRGHCISSSKSRGDPRHAASRPP